MRQRNVMNGLDMEQNPQNMEANFMPLVNTVPNLEAHPPHEPYDNNPMFYGLPQHYHHQRASNLGPGMSTAPSFYQPYPTFHAPPSHLPPPGSQGAVGGVTFNGHERNAHFMDHGYKRKSAQVMPGNSQYPAAAPPCSFPPLNTYPQQPLDQRSVRNRAEAATMDTFHPHGANNFIQGSYAAPPFPPPGSTWYEQHCNGNRSDGSSSLWSQEPPPSVPYMRGNSIDSGNVYSPRYHGTSSSRNPTPFVYPRHHHYISHHPVPPPATVYPHMASASYTVHETMHSQVGPVQSTGFRINQQHPRDGFVPAATLRHHGLPFPGYEAAVFEEGDFYDAVNYVDDHRDMRLDIEDMSYEELLALSDQIGTVKTGWSEEDVKELLKTRTSLSTRINLEEAPSTDLESYSCTICQENYKNQDKIATLDCRHEYHVECLKKWLVIKNVCPICKSEALVMEKKKGQ
uniref:RING-type E3 ubiquitin transferase n=1 Tax=Noccaea caerulescens TaxID=107243 RepID=A0A1J3FIQ8_NOCCA